MERKSKRTWAKKRALPKTDFKESYLITFLRDLQISILLNR